MKKNYLKLSLSIFAIAALVACGGNQTSEESTESTETEMDHSEHMDHDADDATADLLPIPEGAKVWFGNLNDGDTISMPFTVEFGIEGMEVEPAGELNEGKGHHHLLINRTFHERGSIVPADSVNIHYGDGRTETELDLASGEYTLTMQFADGYHQSYGEQMSHSVKVFVE